METIDIPIQELKPAEYNPRKWSDKAIADLKQSIREFGLVDPIIVNSAPKRKNIVIGGHFRLKVAKELGYKNVPVVYVNVPDLKKEKELNLRLNKNLGDWDWDLLANFEEDLLKDVGFSSEELDKLLSLEEDDFDAAAEYEKIEEPKSKYGEVYQLGRHRLICADSTKREDIEKLMDRKKAQIIFTDPPFNVGYNYWGFRQGKRNNYKRKKIIGKEIFNDKQKVEDYQELIKKFSENCFNFSKDDASFYCYYASRQESFVRKGIEEGGWFISQTLIWLKPSLIISPGQDYHRIYEPCYFGWKKGKKHLINKKYTGKFVEIQLLDFGTFEEMLDILYERRDTATSKYLHPTQKPVRLAERALKKHSERNSIVLDPFGGSGSTLIACEQMGRIAYIAELDPKYCDVIRNRYEAYISRE